MFDKALYLGLALRGGDGLYWHPGICDGTSVFERCALINSNNLCGICAIIPFFFFVFVNFYFT